MKMLLPAALLMAVSIASADVTKTVLQWFDMAEAGAVSFEVRVYNYRQHLVALGRTTNEWLYVDDLMATIKPGWYRVDIVSPQTTNTLPRFCWRCDELPSPPVVIGVQ